MQILVAVPKGALPASEELSVRGSLPSCLHAGKLPVVVILSEPASEGSLRVFFVTPPCLSLEGLPGG
jgi:hypothetical protein